MMDALLVPGTSPAEPGPFTVPHWCDTPPDFAQVWADIRTTGPGAQVPGVRVLSWDVEGVTLDATAAHVPFLAMAGRLGRRTGPYAVASLGDALTAAAAIGSNATKGRTLAAARLVESAALHAAANHRADPGPRGAAELAALTAASRASGMAAISGGPNPLGAVLSALTGALDPKAWKATRNRLRACALELEGVRRTLELVKRNPAQLLSAWAAIAAGADQAARTLRAGRPFGATWPDAG